MKLMRTTPLLSPLISSPVITKTTWKRWCNSRRSCAMGRGRSDRRGHLIPRYHPTPLQKSNHYPASCFASDVSASPHCAITKRHSCLPRKQTYKLQPKQRIRQTDKHRVAKFSTNNKTGNLDIFVSYIKNDNFLGSPLDSSP